MLFRQTNLLFLVGLSVVMALDSVSGADQQTASETNKARIAGQVLMPDQSAAAGADVHLLRRPKGAYILPVTTQRVKTDADGRFVFESVAPGQYKIWAETPKLTTLKKKLGGTVVEVGEDENLKSIQPLVLHEGCNYRVKVVSAESGEPLPTGRVWFGWTDLPRQYRANADGVVEIGGLGVDNWYFVVAAEGYGIQFRKTPEQPLGSTTDLEFKLDPGGDLVGVVQTNEGKPVEGAVVYANSTGGGMTPHYGRETTDSHGRFVFKDLPAGIAIRIHPSKDDHQSSSKEVVIAPGQKRQEVVIISNPRPYGGDCIVTVLDEKGQPIEGAKLRNAGNSTNHNRLATTGSDGSGRLTNLYQSHLGYRVFVRAKGFIAQQISVEPGTADAPSNAEVRMQPGKLLKGKLLEPDGKPAAGIRVYFNDGHRPWSLGGRVTTDKNGEFEIDGLPDQSTLTVYTPRQFSPINDMRVTAGLEDRVEISMQLAAVVRVRAIDKVTGKPIPRFNVKVRNSPSRERDEPRGSFSTSFSRQGVNILGEKKEFVMEHLAAGTPLQVTVSAKGYDSIVIPRVLAVRSDRAELLDVPLNPDSPDRYEEVRGRILQPNGKPVVGAFVRLIVGSTDPLSDRARAEGERSDNWQYYHWDAIKSGRLADSNHCLQFLTTATDKSGQFVFPRVRKDGVWLELNHTGGDVAPARVANLRAKFPGSLHQLEFTGLAPSSLTLTIDRKKWAAAGTITLKAMDYLHYPNCLEVPFSYEGKTLEENQDKVEFTDLVGGSYSVRIEGRPTPVGDRGGFRTETLGNFFMEVPAEEDVEGDL